MHDDRDIRSVVDSVCRAESRKVLATLARLLRDLDLAEDDLKPGTGKFKDASKFYTSAEKVESEDLQRWLNKSKQIQWDYKNTYKRKGPSISYRRLRIANNESSASISA